MAVPSSGQLSLNSIYNELDDDDYAGGTTNSNVSLKNLSDGLEIYLVGYNFKFFSSLIK